MKSFKSHLKEKLKDVEFKKYFDEELQLLHIASQVQEMREQKGISQSDLAKKAHVTQQQISRLENGSNCNVGTLLKVCYALEISILLKPEKKSKSA